MLNLDIKIKILLRFIVCNISAKVEKVKHINNPILLMSETCDTFCLLIDHMICIASSSHADRHAEAPRL